jgi:HEPN domain-containing protein
MSRRNKKYFRHLTARYHVPSKWLEYGQDDLAFAQHIYDEGKHYHFALFHAQQAAEKVLKAFLYAKNYNRDLRFHSLARLVKIIKKYDRAVMNFWHQALRLTRYYSPTRYPDVYPQARAHEMYTATEAQEAINTAQNIIGWVRTRI